MQRNNKSTALQVMLINGDHPEGFNVTFNKVVPEPTDEQISGLEAILEPLVGGTTQEGTITAKTTVTNE